MDLSEVKADIKVLLSNQAEIKAQVRATNGRVSKLEIWKAFLAGGLVVITILIVPIIIHSINLWITTH